MLKSYDNISLLYLMLSTLYFHPKVSRTFKSNLSMFKLEIIANFVYAAYFVIRIDYFRTPLFLCPFQSKVRALSPFIFP